MAYLPVSVVTELELNSVNPPPDTIKEDSETAPIVNAIRQSLIHITSINSKCGDIRRVTKLLVPSKKKWLTKLKTRSVNRVLKLT